MKKNGFTLIELLGVIVIIGILALITVPAVDSVIKKGKQKAYDMTKDTLINATKNWLTDNKSLLDDGDTLTLTIADLKEQGYLDFDIKNPSSSACLDNTMEVEVTRIGKKYNFAIVDEELVDGTDADCEAVSRAPSIYLLGDNPLNVEINSTFNDPGAKATDTDGNDITNRIITTGTVDTSVIASDLKYKYTILLDGITKTVVRKINVVDTTAPILTGANNVALIDTVTSYDLMDGVSATDNSGEKINIVVKGSVSLGVVGKYNVTYIATDSSGNTTTVNRIITVYSSCYAFDSTTGTITGYTWNNTSKCPMDITIPADIGGVSVKYIAGNAFDGTGKPNKLTSVDFSNAIELLRINDGIEDPTNSYYYGAFAHNNIETINLNNLNKLTMIGDMSFYNNLISTNLTNITFPNLVSIGEYAFASNNIKLYGLNTPKLNNFGYDSFKSNLLTSVDLSSANALTTFDNGVFEGSALNVYNGSCKCALSGTNRNVITNLVWPANPTTTLTVGDSAFASNKFTTLTIGSNVGTIGNYAFSNNELASVTLPSSVTILNTSVFANNDLSSITLPNSITEIRSSAFYDNKLSSVTIPSSVNIIGSGAFSKNLLTSINLPNKYIELGSAVFSNNQMSDSNAFIYNILPSGLPDTTYLNSYAGANKTNVVIPNSVVTIGSLSFDDLDIKNLTIPSGVITIKSSAFYRNYSMVFNYPSTLKVIEDYAFANIYSNNSAILPTGLTTIGSYAFYENNIINGNFSIPNTVTSIGSGAFTNNELTGSTAFIYARNADGSIDNTNLVCYGGSNQSSIDVPSNVTKISGNLMRYSNIPVLNIPNSVTSMAGEVYIEYGSTHITINIDNVTNSISGSPWGYASSGVTINWLR